MNNKITKNKNKPISKVRFKLLIFFFANVRQSESQNHNDEIDNLLEHFMINCHNDLN